MGRAGGGSRGGGGRSGGGSFSRSGGSFSRSSGSFSRSSSSGSSFGRSGSGNRRSSSSSFGGGFGGSSFGGSHFGGSYHRPPRPIFMGPGHGRKTVIINNSGNTTYNGTNTNTSAGTNGGNTYNAGSASQSYTAPKELTPEQKISRAERLAAEAREARKGTVGKVLIAIILLVVGLFFTMKTNNDVFEKANLKGTVDVGYAYDDGFTYNGGRTEQACRAFYEATGIPLYFYTVGEYDKDVNTCDIYTAQLYDKIFDDENHVMVAYYNNVDWWSWQYGANASYYMGESEINDLIDEIYRYWDDSSLSNDAVIAKGIESYQNELMSGDSGAELFAGLLMLAGGIVLIVAIYQHISKGKEAKRYEEEAQKLRTDLILSKPLETFGNQEVEDLKDKYDNM